MLKSRPLGRKSIEKDARKLFVLSKLAETSSTVVVPTDHGELLGLGDYDHTWALHKTIAGTVTVQHTFNPSGAPFLVGAGATGQLVSGLNSDQLDGLHASSNPGATEKAVSTDAQGGTQLLRLGIGASPAADGHIEMRQDGTIGFNSNVKVQFDSTGTRMRLEGGYIVANMLVAPSYRMEVHDTTGNCLKLRGGAAGAGFTTFDVDVSGNLTIGTGGDLRVDLTGGDFYPTVSGDANCGTLSKRWLSIFAWELWVSRLVAEDVIATYGGHITVAPATTLIADVGSSDTTIDVKHNNLSVGDRIYLMSYFMFECMAITSNATAIAGGYRYSVTRNLDGTGANNWNNGDSVLNTGQANSGMMDLYSQESFEAFRFDYIYTYDSSATSYSANMTDSAYFALFPDPPAVGDMLYLGVANKSWFNAFFYIVVAGSWLSATIDWYFYQTGVGWTTFVPPTVPTFTATGPQALMFTNLDVTGWGPTTVNGVSAYWIRAVINAIGAPVSAPYQGARRVRGNKRQYGPTIVGYKRTSPTWNDLSVVWAVGNLDGHYDYGTDVLGAAFGRYAASRTWIAIDETNGLRIMNYQTQKAKWDISGNILIGQEAASQSNVRISAGAIQLRTNLVVHVDVQADGDIFIGENTGAPATTNIAIFTNAQTYNSESMSAGDFLIGDNSASKANIFWDKSAGKLQFRGGQTMQCEIGRTGYLLAGGGKIALNADGLAAIVGTTWDTKVGFKFLKSPSTLVSAIQAYENPTVVNYLRMRVEPITGDDSTIMITSECPFGQNALLALVAFNSLTTGYVYIEPTKTTISRETQLCNVAGGVYIGTGTNSPSAGELRVQNAIRCGGGLAVGGATTLAPLGCIAIKDGISAPSTISGFGAIYIDSADGDLKIKFGDGTVKTIVTDT